MSVLFFSSEAARALAPSAPMRFPAACTAPNPHGKRHADKEEPRTRQGDPTPQACRPAASASSLYIVRPRAAAGRGTAPTPPPPTPPPPSPATASTELRTSEVERRERPVLLEQGRQSSRADIADALSCGAHSTRPKRQASQLKRTTQPWQ